MRSLKPTCVLVSVAAMLVLHGVSALASSDKFNPDLFVSPTGNDADPGTQEQPFRTLDRAREAVRELKKRKPKDDLTVAIRGGTYRWSKTVVFTTEDSASEGYITTYAAYPGEKPIFTSGVPITGWREVADVAGQADAAKGKLWAADVPEEIKDISSLFEGDQRLPRARGQGFVPRPASACDDPEHAAHLYHLHFSPGTVPPWSPGRNWELLVVPEHPWVVNLLPIISVDGDQHVLRTDVPATYALAKSRFGHFDQGTAWIENAIETLDEPGEWVFDAAARRIYLWPKGDRPSEQIVAPTLTEYIKIEGETTDALTGDVPTRGLIFRGLTFTHGDRFKWTPDKTGLGLQHDWEMFDRPTAMFRLRAAEDCTIEGCRFVNSAGAGIRLDLHAKHNSIHNNLIAHLGGVGVLLAGYGPGLKDVNRMNEVANNHIHHVGELLWHSPAVFVWQSSDNRIVGNLIHDCPYTAIVVSGRIVWDRTGQGECSRTVRWDDVEEQSNIDKSDSEDPLKIVSGYSAWKRREKFLHGRNNLVERNEIHSVMQIIADGNCIYVSGAGGDNIIRANYLHNVVSSNMNAAIRCDDDQHGTTITGNLIWRTSGEGFINKGNNAFVNNIIADLRLNQNNRGFVVLPYGDVKGATFQSNIFYSTNAKIPVLFEGKANPKQGTPATTLRLCNADKNLYFCTEDSNWAREHLRTQCDFSVECNSLEADPRFTNAAEGDFTLLPESPAHKLGFKNVSAIPIKRNVFPFNE